MRGSGVKMWQRMEPRRRRSRSQWAMIGHAGFHHVSLGDTRKGFHQKRQQIETAGKKQAEKPVKIPFQWSNKQEKTTQEKKKAVADGWRGGFKDFKEMELTSVEPLSYVFCGYSLWLYNCGRLRHAQLLCSNLSLKGSGKDHHVPVRLKKENLWSTFFL